MGKIASLKDCVFVNSALKIQYHILKNTLYRLRFWRFSPLGFGDFSPNTTIQLQWNIISKLDAKKQNF